MYQLKKCKCNALQSLHTEKFRRENGIFWKYIIIIIIIIIIMNSEGLDVVPVN